MPRPQRPGPSSLPAPFPATLMGKAKNNHSTYRAFHTWLPSANSGAKFRGSVGTCQFSFMSWLPPQRLLGPRPALSLKDLSNFKTGSFPGLLSGHWGGLLNLLLSAWILPTEFSGGYILGNSPRHAIWKDILPTHTKQENTQDFMWKVKANTFQNNFRGLQERGHETAPVRRSSPLLSQNKAEGGKEDTYLADDSTLSCAQSLFLKSCNRNFPRLNSTPCWLEVEKRHLEARFSDYFLLQPFHPTMDPSSP